MKFNKIFASTCIAGTMLFSNIATAATTAATTAADTHEKVCEYYAENAESIQRLRQSGIAMSRVMQAVIIEGQGDTGLNKVYRQMVIRAYNVPRYATEAYKARAAEDFRDSEHLFCLNLK